MAKSRSPTPARASRVFTPPASEAPAALALHDVSKSYGSTRALAGVTLAVAAGEIHALVGENGAGKTTLAAIAAGTLAPSSGHVERAGTVGLVHQHFELVDRLRVWENVVLGREPRRRFTIDAHSARERVRALSERYGLHVDPDAIVERLPVGVAQRVEILRELAREPRVLILDEPTAVLAPAEIDALFATLRTLAASGTAILLVTHKLPEVIAFSDRVTVLRSGSVAARLTTRATTAQAIARAMVGGEIAPLAPRVGTPVRAMLVARGLTVAADRGGLHDADVEVRANEIVGIAGVEGNGQTALADALAGLVPYAGTIALGDTALDALTPRERIAAGLRTIAQDRRREALVLDWPIAENVALGDQTLRAKRRGALVDAGARDRTAAEVVRRLDIRTPGVRAAVGTLSGGNQQKVVVGRALMRAPRAVIAYQPTRGIDVGAASLVQSQLIAARNAGCAVLLISFELDELFALADRIYVMHAGRIAGEFTRDHFERERIGALMAGTA